MTPKQQEYIKDIVVRSQREKNGPMVDIPVYWEFNTMDYGGKDVDMNSIDLNWLKRSLDAATIELCGTGIDWGNFQIGKKQNDASLFWLKSIIWVKNPLYADRPAN